MEDVNERLARFSEKMKTLESNDLRMADSIKQLEEGIKSIHKIVSISNGTPSLVEQMREIRKIVTDFILDYNTKEVDRTEQAKKWDGRTWGIIQSVIQWGLIAYLSVKFIGTP